SISAAAEPPRGGARSEREDEDDEARCQVRRSALPRLERREEVHQKRGVVEPVRIETASVDHVPGPRDDALLVGTEERERAPVCDPDNPKRGGSPSSASRVERRKISGSIRSSASSSSSSLRTSITQSRPSSSAARYRSSSSESSSSSEATARTHASAPASCACCGEPWGRQSTGSPVVPGRPSTAPCSTSASAPSSSAARAASTSPTKATREIPSPSEIAWLKRRDPVTRCNFGANA